MKTKCTLIVVARDPSSLFCSSAQAIAFEMDFEGESNVKEIFDSIDWLKDFELVAVVEGRPRVKFRDDSRVEERGVE